MDYEFLPSLGDSCSASCFFVLWKGKHPVGLVIDFPKISKNLFSKRSFSHYFGSGNILLSKDTMRHSPSPEELWSVLSVPSRELQAWELCQINVCQGHHSLQGLAGSPWRKGQGSLGKQKLLCDNECAFTDIQNPYFRLL